MNSEAVTYSEFTNALSNPVLLGLVNVSPLSGSIIIELADNLGYAIVDRMLGGLGTPLDKPRDFSEIELLILESAGELSDRADCENLVTTAFAEAAIS